MSAVCAAHNIQEINHETSASVLSRVHICESNKEKYIKKKNDKTRVWSIFDLCGDENLEQGFLSSPQQMKTITIFLHPLGDLDKRHERYLYF